MSLDLQCWNRQVLPWVKQVKILPEGVSKIRFANFPIYPSQIWQEKSLQLPLASKMLVERLGLWTKCFKTGQYKDVAYVDNSCEKKREIGAFCLCCCNWADNSVRVSLVKHVTSCGWMDIFVDNPGTGLPIQISNFWFLGFDEGAPHILHVPLYNFLLIDKGPPVFVLLHGRADLWDSGGP